MTVDEWLNTRQPPPPPQLMDGLKAALASALQRDSEEAASIFLITAQRMLRELVSTGETDRTVAASLLMIDALTTYALEAATETAQGLGAFADEAISTLANTQPPNDEQAQGR